MTATWSRRALSPLALLTACTESFFAVQASPVHCRMFTSIPGHWTPVKTSHSSQNNQKYLQMLPNVLDMGVGWRANHSGVVHGISFVSCCQHLSSSQSSATRTSNQPPAHTHLHKSVLKAFFNRAIPPLISLDDFLPSFALSLDWNVNREMVQQVTYSATWQKKTMSYSSLMFQDPSRVSAWIKSLENACGKEKGK